MLDIIIKNGTVINADGIQNVDIGIKDGKIVEIGESRNFAEAEQVIDATGLEVFPGMIDSHVHVNLKLGEFSTLDSFSKNRQKYTQIPMNKLSRKHKYTAYVKNDNFIYMKIGLHRQSDPGFRN